ncbi:UNVERIFIED_CONTAM: hypothetical protein FKN15_028260 [Acipenser sinensis]
MDNPNVQLKLRSESSGTRCSTPSLYLWLDQGDNGQGSEESSREKEMPEGKGMGLALMSTFYKVQFKLAVSKNISIIKGKVVFYIDGEAIPTVTEKPVESWEVV